MRSRNIKPGYFKNEHVAQCSDKARLLFIGLWCCADYRGVVEYRPLKLKGELMPFDNVDTEPLVQELASQVDERGTPQLIQIFEHERARYIHVVNFSKHQNPHKKERECGTFLPPPPGAEDATTPAQVDDRDKTGSRPGQAEEKPEPTGLIPDSCFLIPDREGGKFAACPLSDFQELRKAYLELCDLLSKAHDHVKLPKPDTKAERAQRDTLAKLVRLDKFSQDDVIACLKWMLKDDHKDAVFWRGNVHSFAALRKTKDGASKFVKAFEAWKRATGDATKEEPIDDDLRELAAQLKGQQ